MKRIRTKYSDEKINKEFVVYRIYCNANEKSYIGITNNYEGRIAVHWNDAKNRETVLCRSIRKYGKKSFVIFKIDGADTWEGVCELEKEYIKKFNTRAPFGMNMTDGGDGVFGLVHSDETKEKIRKGHLGKGVGPDNPMYGKPGSMLGKKWTKEQKKKLSESCKGRIPWNKGKKCPQLAGKNNGFHGKHHTEETKKILAAKRIDFKHTEETRAEMSKMRKGENHPNWGKKFSNKLKSKLSTSHKNLPIEKKMGMAKLNEEGVLKIREIYNNKEMNQTKLANLFNVTQAAIWAIVKRKTWTHI